MRSRFVPLGAYDNPPSVTAAITRLTIAACCIIAQGNWVSAQSPSVPASLGHSNATASQWNSEPSGQPTAAPSSAQRMQPTGGFPVGQRPEAVQAEPKPTGTSVVPPELRPQVQHAGYSPQQDSLSQRPLGVTPASAPHTVPSESSSAPPETTDRLPEKRTPLNPSSTSTTQIDRKSGGTFQALVSIGSSLMIVFGLFFGVAWFYKKSLNNSFGASLPKQVVDVLGRSQIAARQQLVLVRFGSKLVLVSMVQGETRTISEITDPLEVDRLAGMCESSKPGSSVQTFRSVLTQGGAG